MLFRSTLGDEDHPTRAAAAAADAARNRAAGDAAGNGPRPGTAEHAPDAAHAAEAAPASAPPAHPVRAPEAPAAERPEVPRVPGPAHTPGARVAVALAVPRTSASAPPAAALPPSTAGGAWSVQVTATREPRTADDLLKRLRARGYDAYIVRARRQGTIFYRVRVGHFPSMEYASQLVSRLRREQGVPEAFVASD